MPNKPPEPGSALLLFKAKVFEVRTLVDDQGRDRVREFLDGPDVSTKERARIEAQLGSIASEANYRGANFKKIGHDHPDICQARAGEIRVLMFRDGASYILASIFRKTGNKTNVQLLKEADRLRTFYRQSRTTAGDQK